MAYTTIDKSSDYFNTVLWSGNNSTQSVTGVGFKPDFVWVKNRSISQPNIVQDIVRGKSGSNFLYLLTNATNAETVQPDNDGIQSFDTDGFSMNHTDSGGWNESGSNYVGWNWLADNTSGSSNTDGSITSTVSANTTSGFSIVSFTGNGSSAQTVGHGLNSAPEIIITKNRDDSVSWQVGSDYLTSWSHYIRLDRDTAQSSTGGGSVYGTAPTSTVFTVGTDNAVNGSSDDIISYCFHSVKGFSKFGKYTGNGSSDGAFTYLGFKPAFLIVKRTDSANEWTMRDNKTDPFNPTNHTLYANLNSAEVGGSGEGIDWLSNGFKVKISAGSLNASGGSYLYMAFAENPFVTSTGIPATAR